MQWLSLLSTRALALAAFVPLAFATAQPASAQDYGDRGAISRDELRDFLREAIQSRREARDEWQGRGESMDDFHGRRDRLADMMEERRERRREFLDRMDPEMRERIRERVGDRLRERIRDRMAERRGEDEGRCFIVTRILRAEDGDVLALVRRRICRD